jgi:hypothetical protein
MRGDPHGQPMELNLEQAGGGIRTGQKRGEQGEPPRK